MKKGITKKKGQTKEIFFYGVEEQNKRKICVFREA